MKIGTTNTFELDADTIGKMITEKLVQRHKMPTGNYSSEMITASRPGEISFTLKITYNGPDFK